MNRELASQILNKINAEPTSFRMSTWAVQTESTPCGTAACVAGWAVLLNDGKWVENPAGGTCKVLVPADFTGHPHMFDSHMIGKELLEIGHELANVLFYTNNHIAIAALEMMTNPEFNEDQIINYILEQEGVAEFDDEFYEDDDEGLNAVKMDDYPIEVNASS